MPETLSVARPETGSADGPVTGPIGRGPTSTGMATQAPPINRRWAPKGPGRGLRAEAVQIARNPIGRTIIIGTFTCLIARQALAAPIRAYLPAAVWYVPDMLVAMATLAAVVIGIRNHIAHVMVGLFALAGIAAISLLQNPPDSVALSMRQFFYLALAIMAGYSGASGRNATRLVLIAISLVAIIGIAYDSIYGVPWKDLLFQGALATKSIAREWWSSGGQRRLAGFCLSSTDSSIAVAGGIMLLGAMPQRRAQWLFWLLAGPAVWAMLATTQKATAAAFCAVMLVIVGARLLRPGADRALGVPILRGIAIAALIAVAMAPVVLYKVPVSQKLQTSAPTLVQRMDDVWPTVIGHLVASPQSLIGYGFGAAADTATDPDFQIVDNAFLYGTVTVGLIVTLVAFAWAIRLIARLQVNDTEAYGALALMTLLCINCITANVVMSGGTGSLYLGFAIGVIGRPQRQVRGRARPAATGRKRRPESADPTASTGPAPHVVTHEPLENRR